MSSPVFSKTKIKTVSEYYNRGVTKTTNIVGLYKKCEEPKCTRYFPCPYVRCQDHRIDFAIKDNTVEHYEADQVEIMV